MLKRILLFTFTVLVVAYLIASVTLLNDKDERKVCKNLELRIGRSAEHTSEIQ